MMNIKFPFAVTHKTKGEGTAVSLCQKGEDSYVIIDFGTCKEEFAYPDRFVYDLMAKDSVLQRELKNMYDRIHHKAPRLVVPGLPLGTRAIDVYDTCCKDFGWKMSKRGEFAQQQLLYAETPHPKGIASG